MEFGFSTREFEVTPERLGVYRPEIHIDNPKVSFYLEYKQTSPSHGQGLSIRREGSFH